MEQCSNRSFKLFPPHSQKHRESFSPRQWSNAVTQQSICELVLRQCWRPT
ncbi:hypothetical protein BVRB_7g159030 [Beta vulgaris subsp. vulgaris]|nr:hypothetical protein BVRB_7g159030 [Beta vulgaris subsp. vulgaris]